jgi:hypothetical protein
MVRQLKISAPGNKRALANLREPEFGVAKTAASPQPSRNDGAPKSILKKKSIKSFFNIGRNRKTVRYERDEHDEDAVATVVFTYPRENSKK